jgi:hypothetical protein
LHPNHERFYARKHFLTREGVEISWLDVEFVIKIEIEKIKFKKLLEERFFSEKGAGERESLCINSLINRKSNFL